MKIAAVYTRKNSLVFALVLVHFIFSYNYFPWFWSSFAGFSLINLLAYFAWQKEFTAWIGLKISQQELIICLITTSLFIVGSYFLLSNIAKQEAVFIAPGNYKTFFSILFYTLNEEIVAGALLLKLIEKQSIPQNIISVGVALLFAAFHFIFFRWIFLNSGNLGIITLLSLFFVGIVRNNLILNSFRPTWEITALC